MLGAAVALGVTLGTAVVLGAAAVALGVTLGTAVGAVLGATVAHDAVVVALVDAGEYCWRPLPR